MVMLLNILYYDQKQEAEASSTSGSLNIGPIHLTPGQVCENRRRDDLSMNGHLYRSVLAL